MQTALSRSRLLFCSRTPAALRLSALPVLRQHAWVRRMGSERRDMTEEDEREIMTGLAGAFKEMDNFKFPLNPEKIRKLQKEAEKMTPEQAVKQYEEAQKNMLIMKETMANDVINLDREFKARLRSVAREDEERVAKGGSKVLPEGLIEKLTAMSTQYNSVPKSREEAKQELEALESDVARLHSTGSLLKQKLPGLGSLRKRYSK